MVDALLQILVPRLSDMAAFRLREQFNELDGVKYPLVPREFAWKSVKVQVDQVTEGILDRMPANLRCVDWIWLKVFDESLEQYEVAINSNDKEQLRIAHDFEEFIRSLLGGVEFWVLVFLQQYDQFDKTYSTDIETVVNDLRRSVEGDEIAVGFVAFSFDGEV